MDDSVVWMLIIMLAFLGCCAIYLWRDSRHRKPTVEEMIQPAVDYGSVNDMTASTMILDLTLAHGACLMSWNNHEDVWVLTIANQTFTGKTQTEACLKAKAALG